MNVRFPLMLSLVGLLIASGCKSPSERTKDAAGGATGVISGSANLTVFNNELSSGGGAFEYPGGNNVSLSFEDVSNSIGARAIRYSWNGQATVAGGVYNFAGFSLMHVPIFADYSTTAGRNLSAAGYTRVTFYARGSLSTYNTLKIEAGGPTAACMTLSVDGTADECANGRTGRLTADWQSYSLPITSAQQATIKDLFKATFIFTDPTPGSTNPGQGGVVYFDQIFYKP